jgi:hypothetical protein
LVRQASSDSSELLDLAHQIGVHAATLCESLQTVRHYVVESVSEVTQRRIFTFDPRFLVFEFIFNVQLRKMQVHLVNAFARAALTNQCMVQQMIMGESVLRSGECA